MGFPHVPAHLRTQPRAVMCPRLHGWVKKSTFNSRSSDSKIFTFSRSSSASILVSLPPLPRTRSFQLYFSVTLGSCRPSEASLREDLVRVGGRAAGTRHPVSTSSSRAASRRLLSVRTAREPEEHLEVKGTFRSLLSVIHQAIHFLTVSFLL